MTAPGGRAAKWRAVLLFLSVSMVSYTVKAQVNGDLRLSGYGASKLAGRLEIYHGGKWGTVCAQGRYDFEMIAASVACRQLGLGFVTDWYGVHAPSGLRYGVGGGEVGLEEVVCEGGERHLLRCRHSSVWGVNTTCEHQYDIAIACSNVTTPYSGEIRLVGGSFSSVGMVELYVHRRWAPLCWTGFGLKHANAVCRQLGYTEAHSFRNVSFKGPFWQLGEYDECGASSPCFTDCLQELPVTMVTSCPGNSSVEVQCMYSTGRAANFTSGNKTLCAQNSTPLEDGAVRLDNQVATRHTLEGTVEVHFNGMWGTLCNEHFTFREADVVCKELGFPAALNYKHFNEGNGSIYRVSCTTGLELHLNACAYFSSAANDCSHSDDIGVTCSNVSAPYGSLTLRGGVGAAGILLVYTSQLKFEPICDARFGMAEAQVACRQLGYKGAIAVRKNSYFGPTANSSRLFSRSPSCLGSESHLLKCTLNEVQGCRRGMDQVGIQCSTSDPPLLRLRLVGGGGPHAGRLEVDLGEGEWGTVCGGGERFGYLSAYVVCRQLSYSTAVGPGVFLNRYGSGVGPIHLSSVSCVGFERSLFDCPLTLGDGEGTCSHGMDVGIECSNSSLSWREGTLRLVNDSSANSSSMQSSGRLEIFLHGVWMTVCGEMFSAQTADVACRQLGFGHAVEHCTNACFGGGRGFIYFAENQCTGRESFLLDCTTEEHNPSLCNHSMDVGVVCEDTSSPPPPPPHSSTPPSMAESSTITSAHSTTSTPSSPSPPPTSKEPPSLVPILQLYFYIGLAVAALIILVLIVAVAVYCICRLRKKHVSTTQTVPVNNYDDPTHTVELTALSKSAEAEAYESPPLEPPPNYDELDSIPSKPSNGVTE